MAALAAQWGHPDLQALLLALILSSFQHLLPLLLSGLCLFDVAVVAVAAASAVKGSGESDASVSAERLGALQVAKYLQPRLGELLMLH